MSMVCLDDQALEQVVGGWTVEATVGLNRDPINGMNTVTAPPAASASFDTGVLNAFNNVQIKGPGQLANIDISVMP